MGMIANNTCSAGLQQLLDKQTQSRFRCGGPPAAPMRRRNPLPTLPRAIALVGLLVRPGAALAAADLHRRATPPHVPLLLLQPWPPIAPARPSPLLAPTRAL